MFLCVCVCVFLCVCEFFLSLFLLLLFLTMVNGGQCVCPQKPTINSHATAAEHLGVRLPASPPPRALHDQELLVTEGSKVRRLPGLNSVRRSPENAAKSGEKPHSPRPTATDCVSGTPRNLSCMITGSSTTEDTHPPQTSLPPPCGCEMCRGSVPTRSQQDE